MTGWMTGPRFLRFGRNDKKGGRARERRPYRCGAPSARILTRSGGWARGSGREEEVGALVVGAGASSRPTGHNGQTA